MEVVILSVLVLALAALVLRPQADRFYRRRQHHQVAYEQRLAELRLQRVMHAAMLRMLDEARRSQ